MELQKLLNKVSVIEAHPGMMSAEQVVEWYNFLRTMKDVRIEDKDGASHLRCKHGCFQSKFVIHVGDIAKINVTLTQVHPESKKYSVHSVTEYCNGSKSQHGAKEYNTWQKEVAQQQNLFRQQHHSSARHAVAQHQHMVHQHQQHVLLHHHH
jgi:hypothetical protein